MAVKSMEEIMNNFNSLIGDRANDDAALTFMEDLHDTLNENSNDNNTNWKKKYEELDETWRNRYRERFMSGNTQEDPDPEPEPEPEAKKLTFENLFKEG